MAGWFADFFRFAWGLLYWNTRKTWFQLRRGRSPCPCQSPSDSGRALETRCDACVTWHQPLRFKRVCPLLVATSDGPRCAANTPDVRPFWGRALGYYGGAALTVYLIGAIAVFAFLRTIGYPISIVHVTWPGLWHRVPQARSWFFYERSNRAFAEGRTSEGLLYLANAYEFDPGNYLIGLKLAKNYQAGQPPRSDEIFQRLLRDHPAQRDATAQDWFRALLPRGDFAKIAPLARDEVLLDPAHAHVWMRALLFATGQTGDNTLLNELAANPAPAAEVWWPLLEAERLIRNGRPREARAALDQRWPARGSPATQTYFLVYRVDALTRLHEPLAALDLLERSTGRIDDEAGVTLKLDALAEAHANQMLQREIDRLLTPRLDPPRVKVLCAQLIRHPDAAAFDRLWTKIEHDALPRTDDTAAVWFSLLCTAGAVGDKARLAELTTRLKGGSSPFVALSVVEAFFRGEMEERQITTFLPLLPLPVEVTYALIERYRPSPPAATAGGKPPPRP